MGDALGWGIFSLGGRLFPLLLTWCLMVWLFSLFIVSHSQLPTCHRCQILNPLFSLCSGYRRIGATETGGWIREGSVSFIESHLYPWVRVRVTHRSSFAIAEGASTLLLSRSQVQLKLSELLSMLCISYSLQPSVSLSFLPVNYLQSRLSPLSSCSKASK